jgi:phosphoglycerate dehydrogenase-like enzyme
MFNIYVSLSDFSEEALNILNRVCSDITVRKAGDRPTEDELCELVKKYDILIIGAKEKMTQRVHSNSQKLKILGTLSIGLDHIDNSFVEDSNIKIINCPNSNVVSVAEYTFALILALYKKLFKAHQSTISLVGRKGLEGLPFDLNGKVLGILGAGRIGTKVIQIAKAFDMKVLCYTSNPTKNIELLSLGVHFSDLKELFVKSDIISIHLPFTNETNKLISSELIAMMKKTAILINTARVNIVDNFSLSNALKNKDIFGAAIDLDVEDKKTIELFKDLSNIILTPHIAGITIDSILRMDIELANHIINERNYKH